MSDMKPVLVVLGVAAMAWVVQGKWMALTFLGVVALGAYYKLLGR